MVTAVYRRGLVYLCVVVVVVVVVGVEEGGAAWGVPRARGSSSGAGRLSCPVVSGPFEGRAAVGCRRYMTWREGAPHTKGECGAG